MTIAMLIAHLLGDYVLQWNKLAKWKSEALSGVLTHGAVVLSITVCVALVIDMSWAGWALLIGIAHVVIDIGHFFLSRQAIWFGRMSALKRFILDQLLHLGSIMGVLALSGEWDLLQAFSLLTDWTAANPITLVGYVFITMPCWIVIEFFVTGIVGKSDPDFSQQDDKYPSILERILITTLVLMGQLPVALMVPLPRLVLESPRVMGNKYASIYVAKLLVSTAIAVFVGYSLRW